ncbi:MAG: caspase domain-containing protein, partial [Burkholderiales bacterium]
MADLMKFFIVRCQMIIGLIVLCLALPSWATRHALLVGVHKYPAGSGARLLPGATNDVRLLSDTLLRQGFQQQEITLLNDDIKGAASPTRKNILHALNQLASSAKSGDFVFIHFSGHGSQQPVNPEIKVMHKEPDGRNETFLPIDIGKWSSASRTVVNAIVDYELDKILQQMLDAGVFVWWSFDSCHSASILRSLDEDRIVQRHVLPLNLGIPQSALDAVVGETHDGPRGMPAGRFPAARSEGAIQGNGGFVAFHAAQTDELAPEMAMPSEAVSSGVARKPHGVFTYTLAEALNTRPSATYRELMQFILSRYMAQNLLH